MLIVIRQVAEQNTHVALDAVFAATKMSQLFINLFHQRHSFDIHVWK